MHKRPSMSMCKCILEIRCSCQTEQAREPNSCQYVDFSIAAHSTDCCQYGVFSIAAYSGQEYEEGGQRS